MEREMGRGKQRVGSGRKREGRGREREREERVGGKRKRETGRREQIRPKLTLLCLTPQGSLTGRRLKMTIIATPPQRAPFPVCFVFYGDGPASHRGSKGFIGLNCVFLNQMVHTTD